MTAKDIILNDIIARIESGKLDWTKPWGGGGLPGNFVSKRPYSGVNLLITMWSEFSSPWYMTYKQATEKGGTVRKGEKGTHLVFWKQSTYEKKDAAGETKTAQAFLLRYYTVFNADQIDGIEFPAPKAINEEMRPLSHITGLADKIGVKFEERNQDRAFYSPASDQIVLPLQSQFSSDDNFAHTFLHELVHSTGHVSRLDRFTKNKESYGYMGGAYAYEELVAEIGQSFLCAELGVRPDIQNSSAYIQGWAARIKKEPEIILKAAGAAQKALNFITSASGDDEPTTDSEIQ